MFRCGITGRLSDLGEAQHKIVIEKRPKDYSAWRENDDEEWEFVKVASGFETVRELPATEEGLKLWESWDDNQKQIFVASLQKTSIKKEDPKRRVVK